MVESKPWKWEIVDKDDKYWNTPAEEVFFLASKWKDKGFKTCLDMGCGFGRNAIYLAKNGFAVFAFDLSAKSVEHTLKKAEENRVQLKRVEVADMLNLPYENNSFDCALAMNVISHTDTNGFNQILREIKRVLKPGGEVYFTVGSKESFWFNNPACIPVDENTKIRVEDGPENGIPHFYIGDEDCFTMFNDFTIIDIRNVRKLTDYGNFSPHYHIWLKKEN
ncbi:MAG: class I SAM-dependent methyltransferase [Clostridia bacterium]|nr:class I SAM-dependent methyltransferase [Clostridia bacterium]